MSRKPTNSNIKRVQFVVKKDNEDFAVLEFFEKVYSFTKRSDSVKTALRDFKILFESLNVESFQELLRKISLGGVSGENRKSKK